MSKSTAAGAMTGPVNVVRSTSSKLAIEETSSGLPSGSVVAAEPHGSSTSGRTPWATPTGGVALLNCTNGSSGLITPAR
jgi:hypothetical protein